MKFNKNIYNVFIIALIALSVTYTSCKKDTGTNNTTVTTPKDTTTKKKDTLYTPTYTAFTTNTGIFNAGAKTGQINSTYIQEASGIIASRQFPGLVWTHNDSGNPNDIFLLDSTGAIKGVYSVGIYGNRDWEDIAIGPGPDPKKTYIYVGDIGDNDAIHASSFIYRFPEPSTIAGSTGAPAAVSNIDRIIVQYPDGPHNAETLMLDPLTKDIYIAGKDPSANIYIATYPQKVDTTITMKKIAVLPLSTLTAGDISPNGMEILMKNYNQIYYWKRKAGESIITTLIRTPETIPYVSEAKGEAIGWDPKGNSFYTTSEVKNSAIPGIYHYWKK